MLGFLYLGVALDYIVHWLSVQDDLVVRKLQLTTFQKLNDVVWLECCELQLSEQS